MDQFDGNLLAHKSLLLFYFQVNLLIHVRWAIDRPVVDILVIIPINTATY